MSGAETTKVDPDDIHDRVTQAYLGELGTRFMENTRRRIHWICGQVRGRRVLDIGCSQGITCILLAREGREVTGIDRDPKAIAEARDYLAAESPEVRDRVRLIEGDAADMPVEEPFDTVILGEILEHLEDPAWLIDAAAQQTAAEGRLVVTVPFGINDFIDHKQTFYLSGPHALISRRFDVADMEMLGKWIGFRADKLARPGIAPERPLGVDSLPFLEEGFRRLERIRLAERRAARKKDLAKAREEIRRLERQLRIAEDERDAAREETEVRSTEFKSEILRKTKEAEKSVATIRNQLKETRNSTSFRLGHSIVLSAKSPHKMLKLPATAWRLYREGMAGKTPVKARSEPHDPSLKAAYDAGGIDAVVTEVARRHGRDGAAAANVLIAAGRALIKAGHPQAELPLVEAAVACSRSTQTLSALMWAVKRQGDLSRAAKCVDEIAVLMGSEPTPNEQKRLDKLRKSAFYIASIFDEIPARGPRRIEFHPRRVAYVLHNCLPYSSGGYATRASGLARGIEAAGWTVRGIARPGFPLDTKRELAPEDVPDTVVVDGIEYGFILEPLRHDLDKRGYMLAAADRFEEAFTHAEPEFVIAASAHLSALPALIAARRLGIPFFYEVRGFWEVTQKSRKPSLEFGDGYKMNVMMETRTAEEAEHVFTLTEPMREEMLARGVTTPITLAPNSCEPERFTPRDRDPDLARRLGIPDGVPVIGYIGTFVQYEGLENLVEACSMLDRRGIDFRLMLVGNENTSGTDQGPIVTEILRIAHETGLGPKLIMTGRVPHDEVENYYSLIDIAPFPRKPQPVTEMVSPMKPLEALAMEKAVVVSSVRALTEMIAHDKTGLVFYKGSLESLADTLAKLIADPALRHRLGAAGRDWVVRERTWKATARVVLDEIARHREPETANARTDAPDPVLQDVKPRLAECVSPGTTRNETSSTS